MALPNYVMSYFRPSKNFARRWEAQILIGKTEGDRKIHWLKWNNITETRCQGGVGLRDFQCFNLALLAKQDWKIITKPKLLVNRVLKAMYFVNKFIFEAPVPKGSSWF